MSPDAVADVVVAGGGVAGASVAAALGEFGYRVLVAEPGLDPAKRLAGELIHPPGARDLAELGLGGALSEAGGMPVRGFAVWPEAATEEGSPDAYLLPYADVPGLEPHGLAFPHAALTDRLLGAVAAFRHVTVWKGARVVAVAPEDAGAATVTLTRNERSLRLRARLVVAADGSASHVRATADIGQVRTRLSTLVGYVIEPARLPYPGFAHVFVGGPAPALAYHLAPHTVRVMFDVPKPPASFPAAVVDGAGLQALPAPFRGEVRQAMASQRPLTSACYSIVPDAVVKGRLALVGDAAGCCHPLTATGLSVCTRDALRLRQALRDTAGDIPAALRRYAERREGPQRTRVALATALYEAFTGQSPEMRTLRRGLLRYWQRSRRGRSSSMALLSTQESRMRVMALEYACVTGHAVVELLRPGGTGDAASLGARGRAILRLTRATMAYAAAAFRNRRSAA